ncbi:MAG TPA: DUF1983 domain-containing protein [Thiobacillus sp.]|uniref:DUF1983 domain-containing protein n=1 Tax=Acidovorax sp. TaxID=1872122 RepID=UPI00262FBD92|nr:DUF1983 domain-containing protein [Acidovorax sp.]HQT19574.1 DUF1983 domain-containing protein [Acidovorax defluvii]HQT71398.1 DUF1983 domain-containing protein [Thiobacillus sp.]
MTKDTGRARLPGLPVVRSGNVELDRWVAAAAERLEVREGARGNPWERVVTLRDLQELGIDPNGLAGRGATSGPLVQQQGGNFSRISSDAFSAAIVQSRAYRELSRRLDDPARFEALPEQVRSLLLLDIAAEAAARGAAIERVESQLQSATSSLAMRVDEITASVEGVQSGVRETTFASAELNRATAGRVTQLQARLDGVGGVTIEESLLATADRVDGLAGEYMLKVNAGLAVAGIGLAASEDPSGATESSFIVQAGKFAVTGAYNFSQDTTPSATQIGQLWYSPALKKSYRASAVGTGSWAEYTPTVPFGVNSATGEVFINGSLRINAAGVTLGETTGEAVYISTTGQVFKVNQLGEITPDSVVLTASGSGALVNEPVVYTSEPANAGVASGSTYTVPAAAFASASSVTVTATITKDASTYSDAFTLYKVVDGADALSGFLTNESHALSADEFGNVDSYTGASGQFVVMRGSTALTTGVTYSLVSADGASANITSNGDYTLLDGFTSDVAVVTLRAMVGGTALDKVFTVTKQKKGASGAEGGYTDYIFKRSVVALTAAPTQPVVGGVAVLTGFPDTWSDTPPDGTEPLYMSKGERNSYGELVGPWSVPTRLDGSTGLTGPSGSRGATGLTGPSGSRGAAFATSTDASPSDSAFFSASGVSAINGDQLLLSNASGSTIYTRQNGSWVNTTALSINGDAVITGTLSLGKLTSGSASTTEGTFRMGGSSLFANYNALIQALVPSDQDRGAIGGATSSVNYPSIYGINQGSGHGGGFYSFSGSTKITQFVGGFTSYAGIADNLTSGRRVILANDSYALYSASGNGKFYATDGVGPFTGVHDGVTANDPDIGDVMVDLEILGRESVSSTVASFGVSSTANQRGVIGVCSEIFINPPVGWGDSEVSDGNPPNTPIPPGHRVIHVNALGEGQINVCGEGGDLLKGDLIVSSSTPGKGMRQSDDLVRSYTVAKARENVTFSGPTDVKMVACIYLCG